MLYTEADLENSMAKIETINFHQEVEFEGIKFWCYHGKCVPDYRTQIGAYLYFYVLSLAGHVLGAAMFMIEIAGVRVSKTNVKQGLNVAPTMTLYFSVRYYIQETLAVWKIVI